MSDNPRSRSMQGKFLFLGKEPRTAKHDEITIWLDSHIAELLELKRKKDWSLKEQEIFRRYAGSGEVLPGRPAETVIGPAVWERPVMNRNATIGFVDFSVQLKVPHLSMNGERPEIHWEPGLWLFEVKPTIPVIGDVIRQIRYYQSYLAGQYFVVSEQQGVSSIFERQGIGFVSYYSSFSGSLL